MKLKWIPSWGKFFTMIFVIAVAVMTVHFSPSVFANAATDLTSGGSGLAIPTGGVQISESIVQTKTFGETITAMVNYVIGFLGFIATLSFIYAGVLWVVNMGNEEVITKSKTIMTYSVMGIIVIILSYSIVNFVTSSVSQSPAGGGGGTTPGEQIPGGAQGPSCTPGTDQQCTVDSDCGPNLICIDTACRNPSPIQPCSNNNDCNAGYVCNVLDKTCVAANACNVSGGAQGTPGQSEGSAADQILNSIDQNLSDVSDSLDGISDKINKLPKEVKDGVNDALTKTGKDRLDTLDDLLNKTSDPNAKSIIQSLIDGLQTLEEVRRDLDDLRETMPESKETITLYGEVSDALNALTEDPKSSIKLRRFEAKYRQLKDLIQKFPVVQARIRAFPAEGHVPFVVTLNGLESSDPTGGTISEYRWSFIDNTGAEVSLGGQPVAVHEFTEPNTYVVKLRAGTGNRDKSGYKTALDGVATIRIKANLPASQLKFRINGQDVTDYFHITLDEAQAGVTFDPTPTVAALGRTITSYEWSFGDSAYEKRTTPSTVVHTYIKPGEYYAQLLTTDNVGEKNRLVVKVFVKSVAGDMTLSPIEGNVTTEFTFQGIRSRSDDGIIKSFEWTLRDKEGNTVYESIDDGFKYRFDRPGTYSIVLKVTDVSGAQDTLIKELKVASRPPVANFQFAIPYRNHPNRMEFNAIDSYDPDEGDLLTYSWDFDGDGTFDVVDSKEVVQVYEYRKIGEFRPKLQVIDRFGKRDQVEKKVSIDSTLSADLYLPKKASRVSESVTFEVRNSNAKGYLWEFGDGETESTDKTSVIHTYNKKGRYSVKLNFFDEKDNSNLDTGTVLIGDSDSPVAAIDYLMNGRAPQVLKDLCGSGKDGAIISRGDVLRLSGATSTNTDGSGRLLDFDWKLSDGTKSNKKEFIYKFTDLTPPNDCFVVSLVVRDQVRGKLSTADELYFKVVNELPAITDFVIDYPRDKELLTPIKVHLKIVNPVDKDGNIKKYRWWYYVEGKEDEPLGIHSTSGPETEMVITAQGQPDVKNKYFFVAELTDNDNGTYNTSERFGEVSYLEIQNGPNLSPTAEFVMDKTTISVGDTISFISRSYDPQGDALGEDDFKWDFDGDGEFDALTGSKVSRQYNTPGEYEVRLKVTHRGLSSSVSHRVFVEPTQSLPQAAFTYEIAGTTVNFDGSSSRFDPNLDDTTLRFEWDFDVATDANGNGIKDDDIQSTEIKPSFTYLQSAAYRVRLVVKDSVGMTGVVVREVNLSQTEADRLKNSYYSLNLTAPETPLTILNVVITPARLNKGDTADVTATLINADGSPYAGKVYFQVIDGSGSFTSSPVEAVDSKARSIFNASESGVTKIRIRASESSYGDLTEEATLNVR